MITNDRREGKCLVLGRADKGKIGKRILPGRNRQECYYLSNGVPAYMTVDKGATAKRSPIRRQREPVYFTEERGGRAYDEFIHTPAISC